MPAILTTAAKVMTLVGSSMSTQIFHWVVRNGSVFRKEQHIIVTKHDLFLKNSFRSWGYIGARMLWFKKGDGRLGSISAHGKPFKKSYDFNPNFQLDLVKLDLYKSKGK